MRDRDGAGAPVRKSPRSVLITDAEVSRVVEHDYRVRRYLITMTVRIVCLVAAVLVRGSPLMWGFVAGAVLLPWIAVIMANDRLHRKHRSVAWLEGTSTPRTALGHSKEPRTSPEAS